jgi:chorismate-pyruvate lyase
MNPTAALIYSRPRSPHNGSRNIRPANRPPRCFCVNPPARIRPELDTLVGLFYDVPDELAQFDEVSRADTPPVYRALLHHEHHMTVTVENFHGCAVDVRVLDVKRTGHHYARKILLTRQSDNAVVQFGIMRLNFGYVSDEIRRDIESEKIPLGHVLIQHDVLRVIHLDQLWRVVPGPDLCRLFNISPSESTYGRTAVIDCNGEPAVELLEIVTPVRE